ncbi:hypothetical protein [Microbacterium sp.]|uniref:hypothetical protein n=1 Tax=Microbacterium sp. TaxID=51671 RepID=UPI003F962149
MTEYNDSSSPGGEDFSLNAIRARIEQEKATRAATDETKAAMREYIKRQRRLDAATAKDIRRLLPWTLWLAATPTHLLAGVGAAALVTLVVMWAITSALAVNLMFAALAAVIVAAVMYVGLTVYRSTPAAHRRLEALKYGQGVGILRTKAGRAGYETPKITLGLIGGWTGLVENGDDLEVAHALITERGLPPVRTDEIAAELPETRRVLDELTHG